MPATQNDIRFTLIALGVIVVACIAGFFYASGGRTTAATEPVASAPVGPGEIAEPDPHARELAQHKAACASHERCQQMGLCDYIANDFGWIESFDVKTDCVASTVTGCLSSKRCIVLGWCSLDELNQVCYIGTKDCLRSTRCTRDGKCRRVDAADSLSADHLGHVCAE